MNLTYNDDIFYIIGVDPGTKTGVAVYGIDKDFNIKSITPYTIYLDSYVDTESNSFTKDADRYLALGNLITELMEKYNPVGLSIESSFINKKFMGSGMKVATYISVVIFAAKKYNKDLLVVKLAPKQVKKWMGDATADKDAMKEFVVKLFRDMFKEDISHILTFENLTEHSIDAMAIGHNFLEIIRNAPYLILGK